MESLRLRKVSSVIQKEIAEILKKMIAKDGKEYQLVTVTKVLVSEDLSNSRIYLSFFPSKSAAIIIDLLNKNEKQIKFELSKKIKNSMRKTPALSFFNDDSLDYIEGIDKALEIKKDDSIFNQKKSRK